MRILYVITGQPNTTDHIFAQRQAIALQRAGISVDVFFLHRWTLFSTLSSEFVRLRKMVRSTNPDFVHARYGTMTGAICAIATTRKLVVTFCGSDLNPSLCMNPIRMHFGHLLSQLTALRACKIICVSPQLKKRLWWTRDRAEIVPDAVNLELFCPMPKNEAGSALGWNPHERIILFNAGYDPYSKGIDIVKQAVKIAQNHIDDIRLVVLNKNVSPDDMPLYYNAADCLILASAWEGSPNVVKEAMACNLPVVCTKVGDVEERLNGVFPSIVTERDPHKMGEGLAQILSLNQRSNGREKIGALSLDRTTERLIRFYKEVLGKIS